MTSLEEVKAFLEEQRPTNVQREFVFATSGSHFRANIDEAVREAHGRGYRVKSISLADGLAVAVFVQEERTVLEHVHIKDILDGEGVEKQVREQVGDEWPSSLKAVIDVPGCPAAKILLYETKIYG